MSRERDIRLAARDALVATDEFDDVWLHFLDQPPGEAASDLKGIGIQPDKTSAVEGWDAADAGGWWHDLRIGLQVVVRMADVELRDNECERLLNVARNALNGLTLGGLACAQFTLVGEWTWLPPVPPERRINAVLKTRYIEEAWQGQDTTP